MRALMASTSAPRTPRNRRDQTASKANTSPVAPNSFFGGITNNPVANGCGHPDKPPTGRNTPVDAGMNGVFGPGGHHPGQGHAEQQHLAQQSKPMTPDFPSSFMQELQVERRQRTEEYLRNNASGQRGWPGFSALSNDYLSSLWDADDQHRNRQQAPQHQNWPETVPVGDVWPSTGPTFSHDLGIQGLGRSNSLEAGRMGGHAMGMPPGAGPAAGHASTSAMVASAVALNPNLQSIWESSPNRTLQQQQHQRQQQQQLLAQQLLNQGMRPQGHPEIGRQQDENNGNTSGHWRPT